MNHQIEYQKPALSIQEQLERLQNRGLIIDSWDFGENILAHVNYYRLSAYCLPFKQRDSLGNITERFQENVALSDVLTLYEFDRKLRFLLMDALERIEISIRTNITHHLAFQYGSYVLEDSSNFHPSFAHSAWIKQIKEEVSRSKEQFIEHFKEKYLGFPKTPIWMAIEVISFGSLSMLFKGLKNEDKQKIASKYFLHHKTLISWMHFLTYIRNLCAHHSRLWNKELAIKPVLNDFEKQIPADCIPQNNRSFISLLILKYLLKKTGNGTDWSNNCSQLIEPILARYPWAHTSMDIPDNWINHPLWKN